MNMNQWQIKGFGKCSSLSEVLFSEGDKVFCIIAKDHEINELVRYDLLEGELPRLSEINQGRVLGRWKRIFSDKEPHTISNEERKHSAESFFLSLFEMNEEPIEERDLLVYLFAVSLERKRVLKSKPQEQEASEQTFIHSKTKRAFSVPIVSPSKESVVKVESIIGDLLM